MGGNRISQGGQYVRSNTSSTTMHSMVVELMYQLSQSWNEELFSSLDQTLLMCEMVEPYTSRPERVTCAAGMKTNNDIDKCKRSYEVHI